MVHCPDRQPVAIGRIGRIVRDQQRWYAALRHQTEYQRTHALAQSSV